LALKTLGKDPAGSSFLATSSNLSTLLGFSTTFKDDFDAACEALRCIANALLLIDAARSTFISKEVNGANVCVSMLDVSSHYIPVSSVAPNFSHIESCYFRSYFYFIADPLLVHRFGAIIPRHPCRRKIQRTYHNRNLGRKTGMAKARIPCRHTLRQGGFN